MPSTEAPTGVQEPAQQRPDLRLLEELRPLQLENRVLRLRAENALLRLQDHPDAGVSVRAAELLDVLTAHAPGTDWNQWALAFRDLQAEA
jgi:hypothetical protein